MITFRELFSRDERQSLKRALKSTDPIYKLHQVWCKTSRQIFNEEREHFQREIQSGDMRRGHAGVQQELDQRGRLQHLAPAAEKTGEREAHIFISFIGDLYLRHQITKYIF